MSEIMVDIETMAVSSKAVIITIGAIKFDRYGTDDNINNTDKFYSRIDMQSCVDIGLEVDPVTVNWWGKQPDIVSTEIYSPDDRNPIKSTLQRFTNWYTLGEEITHIWGHGSHFDIPILENAYKACNLIPPWKFWQVRDTRTLYESTGVRISNIYVKMKHHAMYDAFRQMIAVQKAFKKIQNC